MSTDTILTPEEIGRIAVAQGCDPDLDDGALVMRLCRAIEQAVLQSPEVRAWKRDSELLNAIQAECWDIRFSDNPNDDAGDSSIGIEVVGHFMEKPYERVIGENYTEDLRAAIEQAMIAEAYPSERPEYAGDAAMEKQP